MAKLTDKFSSKYFESRYALNKRAGKVIEVFVENEDDVPFWKHIFNQHNLNTKINPASKTDLARGKQTVLKHIDNAGKFLLLCVDSDYDYLLDSATAQSRKIKENFFVFQTYTYSIENYQCFIDDPDLENIKEELGKLGVEPCNTYLFVQGHTIHDNVVLMFLKPVCNYLRAQKFDQFKNLAELSDVFKTKRNEYKNQVKDLETILNSHKLYESCPLMQKIKDDIAGYVEHHFK